MNHDIRTRLAALETTDGDGSRAAPMDVLALCAAAGVLLVGVSRHAGRPRIRFTVTASPDAAPPPPPARRPAAALAPGPRAAVRAARRMNRAAGLIATSMLLDSAVEHYRGSFHNKAMVAPLVTSALSLAVSVHGNADRRPTGCATRFMPRRL